MLNLKVGSLQIKLVDQVSDFLHQEKVCHVGEAAHRSTLVNTVIERFSCIRFLSIIRFPNSIDMAETLNYRFSSFPEH